jgi:hypothetical protein
MVSPISNHRSFCRVVHDDSTKTSAIFVWPDMRALFPQLTVKLRACRQVALHGGTIGQSSPQQ